MIQFFWYEDRKTSEADGRTTVHYCDNCNNLRKLHQRMKYPKGKCCRWSAF